MEAEGQIGEDKKGGYHWMRRKERTSPRLPMIRFKGKARFLPPEQGKRRWTKERKKATIEETGYEAALLSAYTHKNSGSLSPIAQNWSPMKGHRTFASPLADADDEDCCVVEVGRARAAVHLLSPKGVHR
jgi:hypothetical protein